MANNYTTVETYVPSSLDRHGSFIVVVQSSLICLGEALTRRTGRGSGRLSDFSPSIFALRKEIYNAPQIEFDRMRTCARYSYAIQHYARCR